MKELYDQIIRFQELANNTGRSKMTSYGGVLSLIII